MSGWFVTLAVIPVFEYLVELPIIWLLYWFLYAILHPNIHFFWLMIYVYSWLTQKILRAIFVCHFIGCRPDGIVVRISNNQLKESRVCRVTDYIFRVSRKHFKQTNLFKEYSECSSSQQQQIPILLMGCPVITKWGNYSIFNIPTVVLKDIKQLLEC